MSDFPREFIDIDPVDAAKIYRYKELDADGNWTGAYRYFQYDPGALNATPTSLNRAWMQPIEEELGIDIPANFSKIKFAFCPRAHSVTITASQSWTVPGSVTEVDIWLVGGGAGGGYGSLTSGGNYYYGCGGGGGHCLMQKNISVTPGVGITVTIGAGGASGNAGGTTSFGAYSAAGGSANGDGGSGGGSGGSVNVCSGAHGGSGGSHGMTGGNGSAGGSPGGRGDGILSTINPYNGELYAGGGGAAVGYGGAGGGGNGGTNENKSGSAGTANTGGGGGGSYPPSSTGTLAGGAGGSGICIIYYD